MDFRYFKKPNGDIVKRQSGIASSKASLYSEAGWKECDANGKLPSPPKKSSKPKSEETETE